MDIIGLAVPFGVWRIDGDKPRCFARECRSDLMPDQPIDLLVNHRRGLVSGLRTPLASTADQSLELLVRPSGLYIAAQVPDRIDYVMGSIRGLSANTVADYDKAGIARRLLAIAEISIILWPKRPAFPGTWVVPDHPRVWRLMDQLDLVALERELEELRCA